MTLQQITGEARHERCQFCGVQPEQPCDCGPGVHMIRVVYAWQHQRITRADFAQVAHEVVIFTRGTVVPDPGEVAA